MKASRYNLATEDTGSGETILFNTLYGSTVVIDPSRRALVQRLLDEPDRLVPGDGDMASLREQLIGLKYLVDDDVDEIAIVRKRKSAGIADRNRLDIIVMPNMNCNFACPYCYEDHDPAKKMDEVTRGNLIRWLEKEIPRFKVVLLSWFGGEPLLSTDTVIAVTRLVRAICAEAGVRLLTNVTTNGYQLTSDSIQELVAVELLGYQITIDGPPASHNKTRILRSGKGSFDRVFANVLALARADSRVRISLRVNYNHQNINEIPDLLVMFPDNVRSQLRVVFEPIFGKAELSATQNLSGEQIAELITNYYELAASLGFDVRLGGIGTGKLVYCYAERENQYIVDYKGDVFKCSVSDFSSRFRMGKLDSNGDFVREDSNWTSWYGLELFDAKCVECLFLPLCMGGCRKDRQEHGATGSYCSLVPTNTSHALKSVAFGSFRDILKRETEVSRCVAKGSQALPAKSNCG